MPVAQTCSQKHLVRVLYNKLSFGEHLDKVIPKVNKTIVVIRKLQNFLPQPALLTTCKSLKDPI